MDDLLRRVQQLEAERAAERADFQRQLEQERQAREAVQSQLDAQHARSNSADRAPAAAAAAAPEPPQLVAMVVPSTAPSQLTDNSSRRFTSTLNMRLTSHKITLLAYRLCVETHGIQLAEATSEYATSIISLIPNRSAEDVPFGQFMSSLRSNLGVGFHEQSFSEVLAFRVARSLDHFAGLDHAAAIGMIREYFGDNAHDQAIDPPFTFEGLRNKIFFAHQAAARATPSSSGHPSAADILLSYIHSNLASTDLYYPLVLFEATLDEVSKKVLQSTGYASLFLQRQGTLFRFPMLTIRISPTVFAVDVVYADNHGKCTRIELLQNQTINAQSLNTLFRLILFWFAVYELEYRAFVPGQTKELNFVPNTNVLIMNDFVYKRFMPHAHRRSKYFFSYLRDYCGMRVRSVQYPCEFMVQTQTEIICYPRIDGHHHPLHIRHLIALLRRVVDFHEKCRAVHADIRFANVVFTFNELTEDCEAYLIDFDFAGEPLGLRCYPAGFMVDIRQDGIRHPDAKAGQQLRFEHDCYSAIQLLVLSANSVPEVDRRRQTFTDVVNHYAALESPTDQSLNELAEQLSKLDFVHLPLDQTAFPPFNSPVNNRDVAVPK